MDEKIRPKYMLSAKDPIFKDTHRLKGKGWKKICKWNTKEIRDNYAYIREKPHRLYFF